MGHFALITTDTELAKVTLDAVHRFTDYQIITVTTITEYKLWARDNHSHGVMIDMKTLLRGDHDERFFLNELSKFLPVAKIRLVPGKPELTGSYEWEGTNENSDGDFLLGFVRTMKKYEESLLRRESVRKPVVLNIRVHHPAWPTPLKTNTVNVSMGGLFFISALENPKDKWVEVEFADFPQLPRLKAEIRWHLEWGKTRHHYPGFGVQFEAPSEHHRTVLSEL